MSSKDPKRPYDVFISYSHSDAQWVQESLIPRLNKEGLAVCVDSETFDIGISALANMENAVAACRCTILVLTPAWVKSEWTRFESLLPQHEDPSGLRQKTLPVLLQACNVPKHIEILTRADLTGKADLEKEFSRLIDAIKGIRRIPDSSAAIESEDAPGSSVINRGPASSIQSIPRSPDVGFVRRKGRGGFYIVEKLKEELAPEKRQLVVLRGEGGVGKTTIAAEVARQMLSIFGKRIVWTSADGREDFNLSTLLDEIVTHLGETDLRKLAIDQKKESVRALLNSTEGPVLVVLDNFETVSEDEQKRCSEWIANAPCSALITTRLKVNVGRNIRVDVMDSDEAHEYLERLIEQAQNPRSFEGLDRDSIIQASDANPLVMKWVVAQIDLAQHPRDVLDELAHGEGDAAERVFDLSFNLPQLEDNGRATLLALSLFVPSATRSALADVAGFVDDLKRLNAAVKNMAALCLVETTDAGGRLIIEGLTREFAKARLSKDKRANEFRRRFVAYFLLYAKSHAKTTPEDFDALEAERDNVLTAMDVAFEMEDYGSVMQIRFALEEFLDLHGYWDEAIVRGEQAIEAARAAKDDWRVAMFAGNTATIHYRRGEYNEARSMCHQSLDAFTKLGSEVNIAAALHLLGVLAQDQGLLTEARQFYDESIEIAKKVSNQSLFAKTLHQLGLMAHDQGKLDEAKHLYNESLKIEKDLGDQNGIALSLHNLAVIAQDQGEVDEARSLYNESLEIKKRLGDQSGIAITLHELGRLALKQGELDEARRLFNDSLEIEKNLGDQHGIALSLLTLGLIAEGEGNLSRSAQLFREALSIFEKLGSPNADIARESLKRVEGKK
jgi:tetratricopeptide (TPR) repeat protein